MIPLKENKNNKQSSEDVKTALQIESGKQLTQPTNTVKQDGNDNSEEKMNHVIASGDNNDIEETDIENLIHRS